MRHGLCTHRGDLRNETQPVRTQWGHSSFAHGRPHMHTPRACWVTLFIHFMIFCLKKCSEFLCVREAAHCWFGYFLSSFMIPCVANTSQNPAWLPTFSWLCPAFWQLPGSSWSLDFILFDVTLPILLVFNLLGFLVLLQSLLLYISISENFPPSSLSLGHLPPKEQSGPWTLSCVSSRELQVPEAMLGPRLLPLPFYLFLFLFPYHFQTMIFGDSALMRTY